MVQVSDYLRPLMLKDLRTQCRARGLNPGGGREALAERVGEHMLATQDFTIFADAPLHSGTIPLGGTSLNPLASNEERGTANNYNRPDGQNVGNYLTDRPSSRVSAPPGGASQVYFGGYDESPAAQTAPQQVQQQPYALADVSNQSQGQNRAPDAAVAKSPPKGAAAEQDSYAGHFTGHGMSRGTAMEVNNYSRPDGQNVGNFLSDRPSSRVLAPPGGASQVFFG